MGCLPMTEEDGAGGGKTGDEGPANGDAEAGGGGEMEEATFFLIIFPPDSLPRLTSAVERPVAAWVSLQNAYSITGSSLGASACGTAVSCWSLLRSPRGRVLLHPKRMRLISVSISWS